jgi:hypothetical protein
MSQFEETFWPRQVDASVGPAAPVGSNHERTRVSRRGRAPFQTLPVVVAREMVNDSRELAGPRRCASTVRTGSRSSFCDSRVSACGRSERQGACPRLGDVVPLLLRRIGKREELGPPAGGQARAEPPPSLLAIAGPLRRTRRQSDLRRRVLGRARVAVDERRVLEACRPSLRQSLSRANPSDEQ